MLPGFIILLPGLYICVSEIKKYKFLRKFCVCTKIMVPKENLKICNKDPTSKQNMKVLFNTKKPRERKNAFMKQIVLFP